MNVKATKTTNAVTAAAPVRSEGTRAPIKGRVLMPLPDEGFDVTEVAVPWKKLTEAGYQVVFATQKGGAPAEADRKLLERNLFRPVLGAKKEARALYAEMVRSPEFQRPVSWEREDVRAFDGLYLPGGHAPGMRQYLGDRTLQAKVADYFAATDRPVGAICHGPVLLARATDASTGRSVLEGADVTALPKYMERMGFWMTAWLWGRHYRTYPEYVQDEVTRAVGGEDGFERGPLELFGRRGTETDDGPTFVVKSEAKGNPLLTARWPGDAYRHVKDFIELLDRKAGQAG